MKYTSNLSLKKPDGNDTVNIEDINYNSDEIDKAIKLLNDALGDKAILKTSSKVVVNAINELLEKFNSIKLEAENVSIRDSFDNFTSSNVEGALVEVMNKIKNIKLEDAAITVKDANNHFTATKLDGVLDELFTLADNGKKGIATVIGSPLTSADTFTDMKNKITNLKYTFSKNLRNKDVDSNYLSDTLKNMIDKVDDIRVFPKLPQWFNDKDVWIDCCYLAKDSYCWGADTDYKNGYIYAMGTGTNYNRSSLCRFDLSSGELKYLSELSDYRGCSACTLNNGKFYSFDGPASDYDKSCYAYDISTDSWTKITNINSKGGRYMGCCSLDNLIYIMGGYDSNGSYNRCYNTLTDTYSLKTSIPSGSGGRTPCVVYGRDIYVIGMNSSSSKNFVYHTVTDTWVNIADNLTPRDRGEPILCGDYIYLFGGWSNPSENSIDIERYDIKKNIWEVVGRTPETFSIYSQHCMAEYEGNMYMIGGKLSGEIQNRIRMYMP